MLIYINIHHKKDNTTQNNTTQITVMIPNLLKYALAAMHKSRNKSHHITLKHNHIYLSKKLPYTHITNTCHYT